MGPQVGGARDRRGRGESELWGSQVEGLMGWMTWLRRTQWQQGSSRTAFSPLTPSPAPGQHSLHPHPPTSGGEHLGLQEEQEVLLATEPSLQAFLLYILYHP